MTLGATKRLNPYAIISRKQISARLYQCGIIEWGPSKEGASKCRGRFLRLFFGFIGSPMHPCDAIDSKGSPTRRGENEMPYAQFTGACFDATEGRSPSIKRHRRCFDDAFGVIFRLRTMHGRRLHCDTRQMLLFDVLSKEFPFKVSAID